MKEIALYDVKTRFSEVLSEVEQGEQVTITRRGRPVARLISAATAPPPGSSQRQQVAATVANLREMRRGVVLEGDLRDLIADGRD